ncbi:hypothetical protein RND71_034491 [Anisodus tanguticus]|uniref:Uncharacterized protein n=1 Tax=Anisodus tanguticus TaxID=243964 RepID=A0AAE1RCR4_9SOLA|nr:hypothetical protein RND71_034491 [Anisodus tanguticus]
MTEVAVNYLVEKLLELGRENVELIAGVQDDVNDLVADLQIVKAFLKDDSKIDRDTAQGWKQSLKEIRNVVYKAEDSVEAKQHQDIHPALMFHIGSKLKRTLSDEDDVVGFEEEANTVIGRLIGGSKNLEAVLIVGMPGLGKSTLARKVYKDSRITFEFFSCIWVNVSPSYEKTDVLLSILKNFTKQLDNKSDEQITEEIRTFLGKGERCLIILDDVWDREVTNFIEKKNRDSEQLKKGNGLPLAIMVIVGALLACKTKREWEHDGQIKTCRIHDMLYEFCKKEASEEDLYHEITQAPGQSSIMMQDSDFCRRLCINSSILKTFLSSFSKKPPMELVRSFLCFTSEQMGKSDDHLKTIHKVFPLIKVLDLEPAKFTFNKDFYRLLHLRYISFSGDLKALQEHFGKFWNLETLIVNTTTPESTFEIKANIWSMLRLRHLHANAPAKLPLPGPPTDKE